MGSLLSILPSDLARTRGGAERYAFELHRALGKALPPDWTTRAIVAASDGGDRHVPAGWEPIRDRAAGRNPPGDAISPLVALAHARKADVVVCHQWRTRATTVLRARRLIPGGPRLLGIDYGGGSRAGYVMSWIPLPPAHAAAHISDFELGVSPVRAKRHEVIRGGVDPERFKPGSGDPTIDFLMVGRFLPYKGQLTFLEALPPGARAYLIGPSDSEDPAYHQAVLERATAKGVPVVLDASDADLVAAYQTARFTVQVPIDPRRYQGAAPPELLGLTMLEAMACGSVPICPGTGASADFVTDGRTGMTYDAGSPDSLSAVLRVALEATNSAAALRSRAIIEAARWTWDGAARALLLAALGEHR